ncbi:uncharacterized protein LOC131029428 [Cryptomeria japonica]|uniref:uncharacterized protein LOC131029428 n=1 Tax=Cryptomeria japonica TaxID=3369 RepID=UPI0025AC5E84|nr:uncharacterized protein LOC131029428 [Cryptomeria japonica]
MLGEGTQEEDEQGKADKETSTYTQPPPNTIGTSTQPPLTTTTQPPILTTSTTTTHVTMPMSTPTHTFVTSATLPLLTQVLTPATEKVTIHNVESDSDQEDEQPMVQLVQRKSEKKKEKKSIQLKKQAPIDPMDIDRQDLPEELSVEEEKEQNEPKDSQDERLLLTLKDQENLLKEIVVGGEMKETNKDDREFEEEVSGKLGELHKQ